MSARYVLTLVTPWVAIRGPHEGFHRCRRLPALRHGWPSADRHAPRRPPLSVTIFTQAVTRTPAGRLDRQRDQITAGAGDYQAMPVCAMVPGSGCSLPLEI